MWFPICWIVMMYIAADWVDHCDDPDWLYRCEDDYDN